jgi:hypothetical protein
MRRPAGAAGSCGSRRGGGRTHRGGAGIGGPIAAIAAVAGHPVPACATYSGGGGVCGAPCCDRAAGRIPAIAAGSGEGKHFACATNAAGRVGGRRGSSKFR